MIEELISIVKQANAAILDIYQSQQFEVTIKEDRSPVTTADHRAHQMIVEALAKMDDPLPVISEESATLSPYEERRHWQRYWLIDPLDGTKEFLNRTGEFTVNIALMHNNTPLLGVVGCPTRDEIYVGSPAAGAFKISGTHRVSIHVRPMPPKAVQCLGSRSHQGEEVEIVRKVFPHAQHQPLGSSLKICHVAAGEADLYLRLKNTSEWDTAAAHAVLSAAGGHLIQASGEPLAYNKESLRNPYFLAASTLEFPWKDFFQ